MLVCLFADYVMVVAWLNPVSIPHETQSLSLAEKVRASRRLILAVLLFGGVIGTIYTGAASPTDAAAVGVVLSLGLAMTSGNFGWAKLVDAFMLATCTSCMIAFIVMGAAQLSIAMGFTGIPRNLAAWIGGVNVSPYALLAVLTVFFIVLGRFLDGISVVVLTTSIILPMVQAVGIDTLWFGIYLVLVVEMSQITPPVGFNLFVIKGLTGIDILRVARAVFPFFSLLLPGTLLIKVFPQIATFLPDAMGT